MNCQIEFVSSDSDVGTACGKPAVTIPAPGTENDDKNPPRIAPRHLFDIAVRLTAITVTNKVALYDFLSTFSGTHFVTPRTYSAELGFHF